MLKTLQGLSLEARALGNRTPATTPSVKETAQYIEGVCSRTSQEIREVIFALHTDSPSEGIGSHLSKVLDGWSRATGISGELTLVGKDMILPPEPSRQLRNILSEALTNIQRHASASQVRMVMKASHGELYVEINDNGCGLGRGVDEVYRYVSEGKLGIAGMKERVELLGGRFLLSSDGNGTRVGFHLPVSQYIPQSEETTDGPDNGSHC